MDVLRHEDPQRFLARVEDHLRRDEPRHNLHLGLLTTLVKEPEKYPRFHLWSVEEGGRVVQMALRTEPHNVVLSGPEMDGAAEALADAILGERAEVPGVIGGLPEADVFATRYQAATGAQVSSRTDQAIHVLHEVADVPEPAGTARPAREDELDLLVEWMRAFGEEAVPGEGWDEAHARRWIAHRLTHEDGGGYRLWADGEPVCLVGIVGPVSGTPALTASVSRELLGRGARTCLLYTDLANPTSNAIYAKIGYRRTCDSAMILF